MRGGVVAEVSRLELAGWKPARTQDGTRLIADVVTGKLDVREVAAGLPDEADDELGDGGWVGVRRGVGRGSGRHDRKRPVGNRPVRRRGARLGPRHHDRKRPV